MKNDLLSIYGARVSKSGKHVNITLVRGEEDEKEYFTSCVKLDNKAKTQAKIKDGYVIVKIALLKDMKKQVANNADDEPFFE